MNFQSACELGLEGIDYLTGHPDLLARFLAESGASPDDLSEHLQEVTTLMAILAWLMLDDEVLTDFCRTNSHDYREVHTAVHIIENQGY